MKRLMMLIALAAPFALPAPATAQNAATNGVLIIYGDDRCPTDKDGNEIVVCVRRPLEERYRLPKEVRTTPITPDRESWAVRQEEAMSTGATGIGSCSTVGPGGFTGCISREITTATKEYTARKAGLEDLPLP